MTEDRAQVLFLPRRIRMVWSFVVLFMLFYIQIIPVSAAAPDLASELTVEAITTTGAKVRWTRTPAANPPNIDYYEVSITSNPNGGTIFFKPGPTITGDSATPETIISGLTAGVQYTVSVRTVKGTEKGTPKTATFNAKPNPVPNTSLDVTNKQSTTATASWSAPSPLGTFTEYIVSISPNNTGGATAVSPVASGTTTSSLKNLIAGNQYTVGVKTKSGTSESDVVTKIFTTKPIAVGSINDVTVFTANSATLTWAAVTGTFTNYTISIIPTTGGVTVNPNPVPKSSTTTLLTNLTGGTTYRVTLKTISTDGMESDPETKQFTTKPDKVGAASITVGNTATTTATLTWAEVTTPFQTYEITISPTTGGAKANPASVAKGTTALETALESLTPGTEYTVTIKTKNGVLESDPATKTFRTKPQPVVESNITFTNQTTTTATVSWEKVATGVFNTYNISVVPSATITPTSVNNTVQTPTVDLSGLSPGTEYNITVKTVSGGIESDAATKTFTTQPSAVDVGTIDFTRNSLVSATVNWADVASADAYVVGIQPSTSTTPSITHSPSSATTASFASLSAGVEYNVSITSKKSGVVGDATFKTFRTTPPNLGGSVVIEAKEMTTATAKWTKPATGTFTNYSITVTPEETGIATPTVTPSTVLSTEASPSVALSGLLAGQVYTVSVSTNWDGEKGTASTEKFRTKPDKVSNIQIDPLATTTATIKWTPPTIDAKYTAIYKYQVDIEPPGPTVSPGEVPHPGTSTGVTGMTPGTTYKVTVITEAGNGTLVVMSDPVEREFTAKPTPVTQKTIKFENVATKTATATWGKVPAGVLTKYKVSISPLGPTIIPSPVPGTTDPPRTDLTNLVPGTAYTLTVITVSGTTESTPSSATFTTIPAPVTRVDTTPSFDSVHMTIYKPEGTVSSVEISCSGPSAGTQKGCTFPKSGIFTGDTYNLTYDKLDAHENYTFTITVTSNKKKSAPKVVTVKTLHGRPGPPFDFKATAQSPTSLKLEWKTPLDPNGEIATYVVEYTGTYKATPNLNLPMDKKTITFDGLDPNAGSYVKTLEGLKGGYEYNLLLYGKTTYPGAGENANSQVTMPTSAPTLAAGFKSPESPGMKNETIIMAVFYKAFNESNGPILNYSVIVAENKDEKAVLSDPKPDGTIHTWQQVKEFVNWPPYMAIRHCDIFDTTKNCEGSPAVRRRKRSTTGDSVEVTIGIEDCKNKGNDDICNGALKPGTFYQLLLRGYTEGKKYNDTLYSKRIPTAHVDQTGTIVGVVVGLLVVLFIAAGVAVFFFIKYKKAEKEKKYRESQPDGPPSSPTDRNRPVRLSDFPGHHAFMHADTDFRFAEEYEDLKDVGIDQLYRASELPHNRVKNRFTNILPYDWSRVKLSPLEDEEGSDYINANYIPGFTSKREYIACQGPLVSTKDDFWRMIWEQNCQAIVMLTRCVENGREKCSHYWPEDTDPVIYGDIEVVILNETQTQDYSITQLRITKGEDTRRICHYHFLVWPDFSAPDISGPLLRFLRTFREREGFDSSRPMCVHCSAGVGRSGTFITLDRLTQHMKQHDYVDIYGTVYEMRKHRRYMVQTEQQYIFIHRAILDIINETVKTSAPSSPASGRENPAFEDVPLDDKKISDDEGITLEVLS